MKQTTPVSIAFVLRNAGLALFGIGCVMAGEYFFRHYVLFWMPTIGNLHWRQEMAGVWQAVRECLLTWKCAPWILLLILV
jgi:hypothetical protein